MMQRKRLNKPLFLLVISFFLVTKPVSSGQSVSLNDDYAVKANIIYHLSKYIHWPEGNQKLFVIGVVGENAFEKIKKICENRMHEGVKINVIQIENPEAARKCSMVFISEEENGALKSINKLTSGQPLLIITEKPGMALQGAGINFIVVSDKLKLELNKTGIEQRGIKVSSDLVNISIVVSN
jgi:hypothetical protein